MRKKGLICIIALSLIVATVLGIFLFNKNTNTTSYDISCEIKRASSYNEITDDDYKVDNCEYVKFNAFFIRDLDGDGYAEKYDGTCNYIDKSPTLYFDINVLTDGSFQNGKITINGKNFNLSTTLVKDEVIKSDYISTNTTSILLNDINYGTQKLFSGNISANIGNNINNYSREDNTIVLTGTWVSTDGTQSVNINKTITLKTDWYGKTRTEVYPYITTSHDISTVIGTENVNLTFSVGYKETAKELLIQKQVTEVTIPDLNGYAPTEVTVTSQNCNYEYNEESKILTITRNAVVDDNGNITSSVSRENTYEINVTYPIAAQDGIDTNTISITFPTTGYYYGYNNSSDEFEDENPYISSISKAVTHTWKQPSGSIASVFVDVGKTVWNSDTHSYRQLISKKLPVNIYNNVEQENDEKDEYSVIWRASTGSTAISELKMEETNCDKFLKN